MNQGRTITILLVEDSDFAATHALNMLAEARGPQFDPRPVRAIRLADATRHLSDTSIDVVLLDLTLPDSTGLATFTKVHSYTPDVPVVVLSGLDDEDLAIEAVRKGADDYLIKGKVSSDLLKRSILYAIERRQVRLELAHYQEHLEELVDARTADLKKAYERVTKEVEARKNIQRDLAQNMRELENANGELEHFVKLAAHDLQAPLRMVSINTELLNKYYLNRIDPDADEFLHNVLTGTRTMHRLINGLLSYSAVGRSLRHLTPTDLRMTLRKAVRALQPLIVSTNAAVSNDPLPIIQVDGEMLVRLFSNLIENAIRFRGDKAPRVHVSAERKGSTWVLSVRDNGMGIDPRDHARIFRIFQRLNRGATDQHAGIGLAICRRIVECHDGRIWVDSQPGAGSTFRFTLPDSTEAAWLHQ